MTKVLIYTHEFPPYLGGVGSFLSMMAHALHDRGLEIRVLAPSYGAEDKNIDKNAPFDIKRIDGLKTNQIDLKGSFGPLLGCVREFDPNMVIIGEDWAMRTYQLARYLITKPYVVIPHGSELLPYINHRKKYGLRSFLTRKFYQGADHIISLGDESARLIKQIPVQLSKITPLGVCVNTDVHANKSRAEQIRKAMGWVDNIIVMTCARVRWLKGQDTTIKAMPQVLKEYPNAKYVVVGEGAYRKELEELVDDLGLDSSVVFFGHKSNSEVHELLDVADIFVHPSKQEEDIVENGPIALLEAALHEIACVGGESIGIKDVLIDGETGYIVNGLDEKALAKRIIDLIGNRELRLKFGKTFKKQVIQTRSIENFAARLEKMILRLDS